MYDSFIVSTVTKLTTQIKKVYLYSKFNKIIISVSEVLSESINNSKIINSFTKNKSDYHYLQTSICYNCTKWMYGPANYVTAIIKKMKYYSNYSMAFNNIGKKLKQICRTSPLYTGITVMGFVTAFIIFFTHLGFSFSALFKLLALAVTAILIFWKAKTGIFIIAALIPFFPTQYIMSLTALSFLSLLFKSFSSGKFPIKFSLLNLFVLLFAGNVIFGVLISFNRGESIYAALISLVFIVFYFTASGTVKSRNMISVIIMLLVISGSVVSAYGLYQYVTGLNTTNLWIDQNLFEGIQTRIYSTLQNPNVLGEFLVILIPLAIFLFIIKRNRLSRIIFGAASAIMFLSLILTYSRSAWIGFMFSILIFTVLCSKHLLPLATTAVLITPLTVTPSIINRLQGIGTLRDTSTQYRIAVWIGSFDIIKDYWLCGIGMGINNFDRFLSRYAASDVSALHAHNTYLQVTAETGILGIILFMGIILLFLRSVISAYIKSKNRFDKVLSAALLSSMAGYLIIGIFDNTLYDHRILLLFWVILSLGALTGNAGGDTAVD